MNSLRYNKKNNMETKESFKIIASEINDVTSSCTSVANQCVEIILSQI